MIENRKFKILDIFAGAGGLSLGFEQTKKFVICAGIEKDDTIVKHLKKIILTQMYILMF